MSVYLRGGTYEISDTFELDLIDSGTYGFPIEYTAYENEHVRLTGAKQINASSFAPLTDSVKLNKLADEHAGANIMVCSLEELGLTNYGEIGRRGHLISRDLMPQMELSVDGERQILARYPNEGFTKYDSVIRAGERTTAEIENGAVFQYNGNQPEKWNKPNEIFVSGVLSANYQYDYYPVKSIDITEKTVTLSEGAIVPYYSKHFFWYENIFEEIDSPGEYYIDREEGLLYWYPPKNLDPNTDISVSYIEKPLIKTNTAFYVTFNGLYLDGGRDRGITAGETEGLKITNCDLRNFGKQGIYIGKGKKNLVSGCRLYNIGNTAITAGGGDYVNLEPSNNVITNNEISKCSTIDRSYSAGILLSYQSVGATVSHNKIYDTPHAAIIIYGPEHRIEYNEIYNAVSEYHDMDAVYMNVNEYPWERGVVFYRNYIHDLGKGFFAEQNQMNIGAIRTDNSGHGITVTENVFYNIGFSGSNGTRAVMAQGTRNVIQNNMFIDTAMTYYANTEYIPDTKYDMENTTIKEREKNLNARLPVYGIKYPELYNFFKEHPRATRNTNVFKDNLVVNTAFLLSTANGAINPEGFRGAAELVNASGNYRILTDPGFVDYNNKSFKLSSDSIVYQTIPEFVEIPFDKIGLID